MPGQNDHHRNTPFGSRVSSRTPWLRLVLLGAFVSSVGLACGDSGTSTTSGGSDSNESESASDASATSGETTSDASDPATTAAPEPDMGAVNPSMCSLLQQDCVDGEKCVPFNENGGIFPDGVKCVPETPNADEIGSECVTFGGFGTGEDSCVAGALCLDLDDDGMATCVEFCSGQTAESAFCEDPDYTCVELFEPVVPLCFQKCNPLVQDCPNGEGCFMDAPMLGSAGFVCMPLIKNLNPGGGIYGDECIAMSNCAEGFSCVFAENVPGCSGIYCCTPWCETNNPDYCLEHEPTLNCIKWFPEGEEPPDLANVGICGILP